MTTFQTSGNLSTSGNTTHSRHFTHAWSDKWSKIYPFKVLLRSRVLFVLPGVSPNHRARR
jgi:hypothetical protein